MGRRRLGEPLILFPSRRTQREGRWLLCEQLGRNGGLSFGEKRHFSSYFTTPLKNGAQRLTRRSIYRVIQQGVNIWIPSYDGMELGDKGNRPRQAGGDTGLVGFVALHPPYAIRVWNWWATCCPPYMGMGGDGELDHRCGGLRHELHHIQLLRGGGGNVEEIIV
jgi:hypothetical protein